MTLNIGGEPLTQPISAIFIQRINIRAHLRAYLPVVIRSENSGGSILGRVWQPALFTASTSGLYNPSTVQVSWCVHCSCYRGRLSISSQVMFHTTLIRLHSRCFTTVLKRFLRLRRKYLPSKSLSSRIISGNEVCVYSRADERERQQNSRVEFFHP